MTKSEVDQKGRHISRRSILWTAVTTWISGAAVERVTAQSLPSVPAAGQTPVSVGAQVSAGVDDVIDLGALLRAAAMGRTGRKDDIGRVIAGEIRLPPGRYRLDGPLDLAPETGVTGLTISGAGVGTEILFDGASATIRCASSRGVTFRDVTLRSVQGVDADQAAFTVEDRGNPLRSWRFERCDFIAFGRCFAVSGAALDSEFYFDKCQFMQCYYLMDNANDQAVNWNFVNCNWENSELATQRDERLAAAFRLTKGTFVKWTGGSMVFRGRLVLYELRQSGSVQRPSHLIAFDGVRIEVEPSEGMHVPFVDRIDDGYVSGTNQPTTVFTNCTILQRGPAAMPVYARAWANCSLALVGCKAKGGRVVGVLDHVSPTQTASIRLENTHAIAYEEDIRQRLNTHDQHNLLVVPDGSAGGVEPMLDQRLCSLSAPATMHPKYMYVRGPTGSLPLGGTTVNLLALPDHTMLMRLFVRRFEPARHRLAVELRDRYGHVSYGAAVLESGTARSAEGDLGVEIGFQIPSGTPLVLAFVGTPEMVKGIVGVEYL